MTSKGGGLLANLLVRLLVLAVAIGITAKVIPGINLSGGFLTLLWVSLLFGLVNAIIGTILRILTLPLTLLTFGLFLLIVNTALLAITAWLTDDLNIDGFWPAFWGALLISIISWVLNLILRDRR